MVRLRVEELAEQADVSVDTIRFYQKRRLVPPPVREGRVAWYGPEHLDRLARIRELQAQGLTLALIGRVLTGDLDATDAPLAIAVADAEAPEEFLSLAELAQRSGVPESLLEAVAREGLLVPRAHDGAERFTASDIDVVRAGLSLLESGFPLSDLLALAREHNDTTRDIAEQAVALFDRHVRTNTLAGPEYDASIVRVKETSSSIAISLDGNGRYCYLDPREGTKLMVAEACRNVSTVGALPVAATNNLNFGNPERPEIMAQLVESIEGMAEACAFFETPITGGNVSLYNETLGEGILPSPVIGIVGLMKTAAPPALEFQNAGRAVMLIGGIGNCDNIHFGGTQFAQVIIQSMWGLPPALDMAYERNAQAAIREVVLEGAAESSHDVGEGGLAVALAECSFGGIGAEVNLESALAPEFLLFHEGPSRIVVSTSSPQRVEEICRKHSVECVTIGETIAGRLFSFSTSFKSLKSNSPLRLGFVSPR